MTALARPRSRQPRAVLLDQITLDRRSKTPLQRQLYEGLRAAILAGWLKPGDKLPSSRALALELELGRNTVIAALEHLVAEGYVESRPGAGHAVAPALPEAPLEGCAPLAEAPAADRQLSRRGRRLNALQSGPDTSHPALFTPGVPALDLFPTDAWRRALARAARIWGTRLLTPSDPLGWPELRAAVAAYLGPARGLSCSPDQVMILGSARQAVALAAQLLADPGERAWLEEPGFIGARASLSGAGIEIVPVPVDQDGLDVAAGISRAPDARLAYVSPSHQYPLGTRLTLARRLALIDWASASGGWIIEDDYDGEFSLAGRPLTALAGLDRAHRVLYIGTFSKSLFPGLRLGYMVLPADLVPAFRSVRVMSDGHPPTLSQAALADFIASGAFTAHIRRMRRAYAERQAAMLHHAAVHTAGRLTLRPAAAGMHLTGLLPPGTDDVGLIRRLRLVGLYPGALSRYYFGPATRPGLVLGFAASPPAAIAVGMQRLGEALENWIPRVVRTGS